MVGKLLNIFEADHPAIVPFDCGKAGGSFVNVQKADGLEGCSRPTHVKGPGTHLIGARDNGRGQKEGIFQGDSTDICAELADLTRIMVSLLRWNVVKLPHQRPNGDLPMTNAGLFTGRAAIFAGQNLRQLFRRSILIVKPDAAKHRCAVYPTAGLCAGCVPTQGAAQHFFPLYLPDVAHAVPPFVFVTASMPDTAPHSSQSASPISFSKALIQW